MEPEITKSQWFQAANDDDCVVLQTNLNDFQRTLDSKGETALMVAVRAGNLAAAHILAEVESKMTMPTGHTALMLAAGSNNTDLCRLLAPLESGITTDTGVNALMIAADTGSDDALRVLVDYIGDDTDSEGHTALFYAALSGHIQCANILVRAFPPTKKEIVSCIDMATTQGDLQMLDFLNGLLQEIVGSDSINDVIREYRNAAALERSISKGGEPTSIDHVSYDDARGSEAYCSANISSDEQQHAAVDSMYPYSVYASPPGTDTPWDLDSKNDLVVSDTSIDVRSMPAGELHANLQQGGASVFNSVSPTRHNIGRKGDEVATLRSQLHTATYEIQRLQNLLKEQSCRSWESKFANLDNSSAAPTTPDTDIRRLQDKCSSLELKVSSLELKNKQLRTSLDDLEQGQSSKVFPDAARSEDATEELTVEQILEFLHNNKDSAEQVYNDLKRSISVPEQSSTGRPLSIVPIDADIDGPYNNADDVGSNCSNISHSSSIEMVEMRSPTPGCNVVPGLEERLETENLSLHAEIEALTRQLATRDEQIKTLRQELYDLRQSQLKMSMTMGPSMESVRPQITSNKYDLSETNHEIEVDMTISNTSFSFPESHCGTKGESAGSNQVVSEGREYVMSLDIDQDSRSREPLAAKLPPLPGTKSNEFTEINASVVQIKLNKVQLELQEALDDKQVILDQLKEERNEKSQLVSELTVCRDTIDHMTSEIEELKDRLDESLAKESILSNDILELRGRMASSPRPGECGSPVSVLGFNDNNRQPSPKMDDIYDIIRNANSYHELLIKLNFSPDEIDDVLSHQKTCDRDDPTDDNLNRKLMHEISTINLRTGAVSNLSANDELEKELTRLQNSNNELEQKCMDLQSSNVVLSAEAGKLASEVIDLRELLKEQEKRYADLLTEKTMMEARPAYTHRANHDSLYEIQPEQKEIEACTNVQAKGHQAPSSTQSTRPASLRGEGDSHGYASGGDLDNRATSYSGSMTDERCKKISGKRGSSVKQEKSDQSGRRNPFDMRDYVPGDEEDSYLAALQDERDRRMTTQDLEPYSGMTSTTTSTASLCLNLIDGIYTNVTPLMRAVLNDKISEVDKNLMYVRKTRSDGATALMLAAYLDRVQIAEKLGPLEANIRGPENLTALEIALYKENYATAAVLRSLEGIDIGNGIKVTTRRHTDLMTAVTEKKPLTVWCLIPLQGRVQDWSGKTALMQAIEQKRTFCARILATAETRIQDRNGFTALMYAVVVGNNNLVNLLVEDEAGFVGRWHELLPPKFTALTLACYYGRLKAATILLPFEGGMKDSIGRGPEYYAQNCSPRVPAQIRASLIDLFSDYKYK
ncbi:Hypothetical protein GLP15_4345 [Giardia lamblia P15]|uniref:Uncharacterized protein n=1 Tax=Giardia intestinalis (strain P15) TaxID=658858 RepID=E1F776_GIAIA|nr:Hypothetical protein GLP15_4345 [Giardia lamblia P15]